MKKEKSAGVVVLLDEKEPLYLLLHYERNGKGHWDFPKGHIEKGEKPEETAKRELEEETGITDAKIQKGFEENIHFFFKQDGELVSKDVVFFIATTKTKEVKLSFEHTGYEWRSYEKAIERLTFKNSKDILKKANDFVNKRKKDGLNRFVNEES